MFFFVFPCVIAPLQHCSFAQDKCASHPALCVPAMNPTDCPLGNLQNGALYLGVLLEGEAKWKINSAEYKPVNVMQENCCTDTADVSAVCTVGRGGVRMCGAGAE